MINKFILKNWNLTITREAGVGDARASLAVE